MTTYPTAFAVCEKALCFYADWAWEAKVLVARERFTFTGMPEEAFEAFLVGWMLQEEDYGDEEDYIEGPSTDELLAEKWAEKAEIAARWTESDSKSLEAAFGLS
jgi:hypothetical protein